MDSARTTLRAGSKLNRRFSKELCNSGRRSQHGFSGYKVSIHEHVNALRLLLILEPPKQPRIALQLPTKTLRIRSPINFVGFDICCSAVLMSGRSSAMYLLFKSRCCLHNLGLSMLQFIVNISIVFPNVFRAWNCCSLSFSQVQQFQQLHQQSRVCLPGESGIAQESHFCVRQVARF